METNKQITLAEFKSAKEELLEPERLETIMANNSKDGKCKFTLLMLSYAIGTKLLTELEKILFHDNEDLN